MAELQGVRGGPPRPRKRRVGGAEIEGLIVLLAVVLGLAGAGALVGYVLTHKNHGSAEAAATAPSENGAGTSTTGAGRGGTTTSAASGTQPTGTGQSGVQGGANAQLAAGKQVFMSAGCASCHTLKDAGSAGNVGPNLDEAKPTLALVIERVTNGKPPMPPFKGQLTDEQIKDVATYVSSVTRGA